MLQNLPLLLRSRSIVSSSTLKKVDRFSFNVWAYSWTIRFAVSRPYVWNSLPTALRMSDCSLTTFRTELKTLLFIWYIVYRQIHFLTAGQRICGLLGGSCTLQIALIIIIIMGQFHNLANKLSHQIHHWRLIIYYWHLVKYLVRALWSLSSVTFERNMNGQFSLFTAPYPLHDSPLLTPLPLDRFLARPLFWPVLLHFLLRSRTAHVPWLEAWTAGGRNSRILGMHMQQWNSGTECNANKQNGE